VIPHHPELCSLSCGQLCASPVRYFDGCDMTSRILHSGASVVSPDSNVAVMVFRYSYRHHGRWI